MKLHVVPVSGGLGRLGSWGTLELTGAASALLRLVWAEDVEVPGGIASDVTGGVLLLDDELGRLLYLPYAGELVVAWDLKAGILAWPQIALSRHPDYGLRMASIRLLPGAGAIHLTESSFAFFSEDCTLTWLVQEDFSGWTIEGTTVEEVHLLAGDWAGNEQRQARSMVDGHQLP